MLAVFTTVFGLAISPWLLGLLGASGDYLSLTMEYTDVIFGGAILFVLVNVLNCPLTARGDTK